ncbi:hypothetical protein [Chlamydia pecorum]|uniref:Uncharacterized protein n=1 Tax=Chlamydia pecorum TaxID=85991 RepID=A0AA40PQX7_9CHLA|nr:hypothetical protein [Chlamydia pecorum]KTF29139.1 hypothetical protein cpL1_0350 [Chlamydia pecorum]KZN27546.1 hypothetical protein cpL17_0477 [Chlamydia pecorum]KZN28206.1 hypothetical protein cpL71_0465 [Chlamydia pecorum]UFP06940.1 hypothetical protein KY091_01040 [Chlamydia pecorum]UJT76756.1 hypothetical protein NSWBovSBE_0348 [Chlamydia pecorum]
MKWFRCVILSLLLNFIRGDLRYEGELHKGLEGPIQGILNDFPKQEIIEPVRAEGQVWSEGWV